MTGRRTSVTVTRWLDYDTCVTTGYDDAGRVTFERKATEPERKRVIYSRPAQAK